MIKYSSTLLPLFLLMAMLLSSAKIEAQSNRSSEKKAERQAKRAARKALRLAELYADSDFQDDEQHEAPSITVHTDRKPKGETVVETAELHTDEAEATLISTAIPDQIQFRAESLIGTPYRYGGMDSKGYDCSGLSCHVFSQLDIKIPRTAQAQYSGSDLIPLRKAEKGDLVFFGKSKSKVSHVGIVISRRGEPLTMIHSSTSSGIITTDVDSSAYWKPKLVGVGRYISQSNKSATSQR
jgi:cell wall-associated NlpC family hydrolase